jgi:hypothetical protein
MPRIYTYKLTINEEYWSNQLRKIGKKLTYKDKKLLRSVKYEKQDNESMMRIQTKALTNGLHIKALTELVGDCMFESIEKSGLYEDREAFRKSLSLIFFLFGNCPVITSYTETLKQIFEMCNEIEYVFCHTNKRLYKYTYYTMCADMFKEGSWSRLPTEIVLTVISVFFKVRFHIYHDNGHINKICDASIKDTLPMEDPSCNIYLALIGENHYLPLGQIPYNDKSAIKCPKYTDKLKRFIKWADGKSDLIGLYNDTESSEDEDEDEEDEVHENTYQIFQPKPFSNPINKRGANYQQNQISSENKHNNNSNLDPESITKVSEINEILHNINRKNKKEETHVKNIVRSIPPTNINSNVEEDLQSRDTKIPDTIAKIIEQPVSMVSSNITVIKKTQNCTEKENILSNNKKQSFKNQIINESNNVTTVGGDSVFFENGLMFFS